MIDITKSVQGVGLSSFYFSVIVRGYKRLTTILKCLLTKVLRKKSTEKVLRKKSILNHRVKF